MIVWRAVHGLSPVRGSHSSSDGTTQVLSRDSGSRFATRPVGIRQVLLPRITTGRFRGSAYLLCCFGQQLMATWRSELLAGRSVAAVSGLANTASGPLLVVESFFSGATTTAEEVSGRAVKPLSVICALVVRPTDAATTRPRPEMHKAANMYLSQAALAWGASPALTSGSHSRSVCCSPDSSLILTGAGT